MKGTSTSIFILGLCLSMMVLSCSKEPAMMIIQGEAQGTTYTIRYISDSEKDYSKEITDILQKMDNSMSLWQEDSFLSQANALEGDKIGLPFDDEYFPEVLGLSKEVYNKTAGAFNPSIYPLVKAWGFGAKDYGQMEVPNIDSLVALCGFDTYDAYIAGVAGEQIFTKKEGLQLDFNGIAQGYTVDVIGRELKENGVSNFMIEVGGEILTAGKKLDGSSWRIAIDRPVAEGEARQMQATIDITDRALATSGSYRKFYMKEGKRYSHTIDPKTGHPVDHQVLSVTTVMDDAGRADAYATAFMVMGLERSKEFLKRHKADDIEVYIIYEEEGEMKVYQTGRFKEVGN